MHRLFPANLCPRDSWDLLPTIRDLYNRRPETQDLKPWEVTSLLWSLNNTVDLLPEDEIAAAVEVARTPFDPDEGVA
jgi:hypothetical protein